MTEAAAHSLWSRPVTLISETVAISAVLYYFGWAHTQAAFGYFGIDVGMLGFSTPDYALRSINAALIPLAAVAILVLALTVLHRKAIMPLVRAGRPRRRLRIGFTTGYLTATALLVIAAAGLTAQNLIGRTLGIVLPLSLLTASSLLAYLDWLRAYHDRPESGFGPRALVLLALVAVGALWSVALYAQQTGERFAVNTAAQLAGKPEIILYSVHRLAISGPGVTAEPIDADGAKYRFRYRGLRSLLGARDRYILLPAGWRKGRDDVYVIPANDDLRIDIVSR